ncbi:MAG: hypothetical protein ISR98_01915 [Parcubacteria group bacterium]|nr:hypothetical protein [Parcubacteria group bacterium]
MTFFVTMFCFLSVFTLSTVKVNAKSDEKSIIADVMSKEDEVKLRKQLKQFAGVFGVESKVEEPPPPVETKKTIADVADKGLEMVEGMVAQLSSTLQKIAPDVWRIMLKQQYVKAVSGVITPWSIVLLVFIFFKILSKKWNPTDKDAEECKVWFVYIIPIIASIVFCVLGIIGISNAFRYVINPEFYAIKDLLLVLLGQPSAG